jgi:hypothetical protein
MNNKELRKTNKVFPDGGLFFLHDEHLLSG